MPASRATSSRIRTRWYEDNRAELVKSMLEQLERRFDVGLRTKGGAGLTPHQVLTLASIIEREAANPAERPLISAVYHNRLTRPECGCRPTLPSNTPWRRLIRECHWRLLETRSHGG